MAGPRLRDCRSLAEEPHRYGRTLCGDGGGGRGGRGYDRSALGGRTRSRHRPARRPNNAVGAAALCAVPRFLQPDARGACISCAGRRRAEDTAERLIAPKYYGDDEARMHMALEEIANSGGSFLVAVRVDAAGRVRALNDIPVPPRYVDLFSEIPEHRFRSDISSSEIRAKGRPDAGRAGGNS